MYNMNSFNNRSVTSHIVKGNVIVVDVKNVETFTDYSAVTRSVSACYDYLIPRKFTLQKIEEAEYIMIRDDKKVYFLRDHNKEFEFQKFWSVNNKRIRRLLIRTFMDL